MAKNKEKDNKNYNEYRVRYFKDAIRIYGEFHPEKVHNLAEAMFDKGITDPKYAELVVKAFGGFSPIETKDVTERPAPNPYANLTEEELKKLAGEI